MRAAVGHYADAEDEPWYMRAAHAVQGAQQDVSNGIKSLEKSADAIVLGSTRNRRLGRLFSGQVRERTTRLTALPVLTAPAPLKVTSTPGSADWTLGLDQALDSLLR